MQGNDVIMDIDVQGARSVKKARPDAIAVFVLPPSFEILRKRLLRRSLDEAARIDGASHFRVYFKIILPVARPILIFLAITSFVMPWMDFILPNILLRSSENQTLALGLFTFVLDDTRNEFTRFAAGAITVAVPFIIAFAATQRLLLASLGGAVKE